MEYLGKIVYNMPSKQSHEAKSAWLTVKEAHACMRLIK